MVGTSYVVVKMLFYACFLCVIPRDEMYSLLRMFNLLHGLLTLLYYFHQKLMPYSVQYMEVYAIV